MAVYFGVETTEDIRYTLYNENEEVEETGILGEETEILGDSNYYVEFSSESDWSGVTAFYTSDPTEALLGNISQFNNLTSLETLYIFSKTITGDLSSLSDLINLKTLELLRTDLITGDIDSLKTFINLQSLVANQCELITGDIRSLSLLTELITIEVSNSNVSWDLNTLEAGQFGSLRHLELSGHNGTGYLGDITGDIGELNILTTATSIILSDTNVTLSTNGLPDLILLTTLRLADLELSEADLELITDSLIINDSSGNASRNCNVYLGGTNATANSNTEANRIILEDSGWQVHLNLAT